MKIAIINGPNLNLLKSRDQNYYGAKDLKEIEAFVRRSLNSSSSIEVEWHQTNLEGEIVELVQKVSVDDDYLGLVINPAGYSHTSISILDALELCKKPKVEVHLSNTYARGAERQLLTARSCDGVISGLKEMGYLYAIKWIEEKAK